MFELQFSSVGEFLSMGEYAFNVWSVYLLFAVFFTINLVYPLLRRKQILKEQKRRLTLQTEREQKQTMAASEETPNRPLGENR